MGERVNGIHEVRGSIPLASIAVDFPSTAAAGRTRWFGAGAERSSCSERFGAFLRE